MAYDYRWCFSSAIVSNGRAMEPDDIRHFPSLFMGVAAMFHFLWYFRIGVKYSPMPFGSAYFRAGEMKWAEWNFYCSAILAPIIPLPYQSIFSWRYLPLFLRLRFLSIRAFPLVFISSFARSDVFRLQCRYSPPIDTASASATFFRVRVLIRQIFRRTKRHILFSDMWGFLITLPYYCRLLQHLYGSRQPHSNIYIFFKRAFLSHGSIVASA